MENKKINLTVENFDDLTCACLDTNTKVDEKAKKEEIYYEISFEIKGSLAMELFGEEDFDAWLIIRTLTNVPFAFDSEVFIEKQELGSDSVDIIDCEISPDLRCNIYGIILNEYIGILNKPHYNKIL